MNVIFLLFKSQETNLEIINQPVKQNTLKSRRHLIRHGKKIDKLFDSLVFEFWVFRLGQNGLAGLGDPALVGG